MMRELLITRDESIGEKVRYYRKLRGVTQQRLADAVGMSRSSLSALEKHDHRPSSDVMLRISEYLGIPPTCFFSAGTYVQILYSCIPGVSRILADRNLVDFGLMQIVCEYKFEKCEYICIISKDRVLLAKYDIPKNTTRFVCTRKSDNTCLLCIKTPDGYVDEYTGEVCKDIQVMAGIVADVTDLTLKISIPEIEE